MVLPSAAKAALYESEDMQAYWDIPVFAEYNEARAKRVDVRIADHKARTVTTLEMSCPWIQNREKKDKLLEGREVWAPMLGDIA